MSKDADTADHTIKLLQTIQKRLDKLDSIERETREGFASIKQHLAAFSGDVYSYERRLINLEDEVLKIKTAIRDTIEDARD